MQEPDYWYWLERARMSASAARAADDPGVALIHMDLHARHLAKAAEVEQLAGGQGEAGA